MAMPFSLRFSCLAMPFSLQIFARATFFLEISLYNNISVFVSDWLKAVQSFSTLAFIGLLGTVGIFGAYLFAELDDMRMLACALASSFLVGGYHSLFFRVKYYNKRHRGGSRKVTILPSAIILTKAHRAAVSMIAKGHIGA